jgi:hypothetical protein
MLVWQTDQVAKEVLVIWTAIRRIFHGFPEEAIPKISVPAQLAPENQETAFGMLATNSTMIIAI